MKVMGPLLIVSRDDFIQESSVSGRPRSAETKDGIKRDTEGSRGDL